MKLTRCFIWIILVSVVIVFSACYKIVNANQNIKNYLYDKVIYVDSGHGGKDNGASVDGVLEDVINLSIGNYLIESLISSGAYVLASRTADYDLATLYQKNRKREDLNKRVNYINKSNSDIFISIHLNTYSSSSVKGAQVFHQNNEKSKLLAEMIQKEFNVFLNNNKKVKKGDYFILNKTNPIGVLVECGFLSNEEERENLVKEKYQRKVADILKKGILNYLEYMYSEKS